MNLGDIQAVPDGERGASLMNAIERFKLVGAVHLFLTRGNKILLLRRFNTGYEDGNYSVPAGHLDGDESVKDATVREAVEEIGISVDKSDLRIAHVMHRRGGYDGNSDERVDFFFVANVWSGEPQVREPDKCDQLIWMPTDCLPFNTISYVEQAINCHRMGILYSEYGWGMFCPVYGSCRDPEHCQAGGSCESAVAP